MLCSGEQSAWAVQILESLDDTTTPTGSVVSWLKSNLGQLNLRINSGYYVSGDCIVPDMDQNISGLYTEMYYCYYFSKQANKNLGASAYDWTEIVGEEQGSIRKVSKNEVAKTYRLLAKDCQENLQKLTDWYNGQQATFASQVIFGDRFGGSNFDLLPPKHCYSDNNFIWNV